jgi:hypothetical protein
LCVVGAVVVVGVVELLVVCVAEELPPLPPHPVTATVLARMASSVSMAVSDVRFIGRAPIIARWLGRSHYQPFAPALAVG